MPRVFLGLGANLGDPERQLRAAVAAMRQEAGLRVAGVSSLFQTKPVAAEGQPDYLNAVVEVSTAWPARRLLQWALAQETAAGRRRGRKNAARVLDIDVLLYNESVIREEGLVVPHPRLAERLFVLAPLSEIAPDLRHPETGEAISALARKNSGQGVRRLKAGPAWAD